ncbi:RecQ family ATP-dependent DNA helicase [Pseudoneobacillus sp. C159]
MNLEKLLYEHFGFIEFRPGQKEIISSLLDKRDTVGVLPTGTGKSLCYQYMGHLLTGHILIISPLLSLMQDQVEQMKVSGEKRVIAINSFLTTIEKNIVLNSLENYKFIFVSPEMLQVEFIMQRICQLPIDLFVVDEAHCISQWGYEFRTDYFKLGTARKRLGCPLTLALTATATPEVVNDIKTILGIENCNLYKSSVDRPNIALMIDKIDDMSSKQRALLSHLQRLQGPGIVYFSSKKLAEQTVTFLKQNGILKVMAYHGGMSHEERMLVQQQFIYGQLDYICATSAFGMGVNKKNIRFVIHYHLPLQLESYLQEIGRAGRDGKQSIAILLYAKGDEYLASQLVEGELPSESQIRWLADELTRSNNNQITSLSDELMEYGGFTENQWRFTKEFIMTKSQISNSLNDTMLELISFIQLRKRVKITKIYEMLDFITQADCRRLGILKYFGEHLKFDSIVPCCDYCGINLNEFITNKEVNVEGKIKRDWVSQLISLLSPAVNQLGDDNHE